MVTLSEIVDQNPSAQSCHILEAVCLRVQRDPQRRGDTERGRGAGLRPSQFQTVTSTTWALFHFLQAPQEGRSTWNPKEPAQGAEAQPGRAREFAFTRPRWF